MKNKKLLVLIPALAMVLTGCGDNKKPNEPNKDPDPGIVDVIHVESVSLNKSTMSLDLGADEALTATVLPDRASDTSVTWSSDHPEIAEVSERGKVSGKAAGTATITCTTNDGAKVAVCVVTVTLPRWGDEEHPINVATALSQAASDLTVGMAVTPVPMYVEGYVISAANGSFVKNVYIADSATETDKTKMLLVYSADYNANKNINAIYEGDKVMFCGYMQQYKYGGDATTPLADCTLEMTAYEKVNVAIVKCERATSTIRLSAHPHATVTNLPTSGKNDSDVKFDVVADSGFQIVEVAANGTACTKDASGKYVAKVQGPTVITVETATAGLEVHKATMAYTDKNNTGNMVAGNNAEKVNLDASIFEVTADKGEASNMPGLNKAGEIRLYNYNVKSPDTPDPAKTGKNNSIKVKGIGVTISQVTVITSQNGESLGVYAGTTKVTGTDDIYAINDHEFTLKNDTPIANASSQLWITSIKISYTVDPRIACTGITLNKEAVTLLPHMSDVITATTAPADCTDAVAWSSSDETVATVSAGTITAIKAGNAIIKAKAGDIEKTVAVTVNDFAAHANLTGETLKTKAEIVDADGKTITGKNFAIQGYITEITNATYGNGWLYTTDDQKVQLYGLYDLTGSFRYDVLSTKPGVGDFVILKGEMADYSGPELKNAAILQINDTKCASTPATGLALPASADVYVGNTYDCVKNLTRTPADGVANITWESSNPAIATVDAKGVVKGVAVGSTTITGKAEGLADFSMTINVKEMPVKNNALGATLTFNGSVTPDPKNADSSTFTVDGYKIVIDKNGSSTGVGNISDSGDYFGNEGAPEIRFYKSQKITFKAAEGKEIAKIEVGISNSPDNFNGSTFTNCVAGTCPSTATSRANAATVTLVSIDSTKDVSITFSKGATRFTFVKIYYVIPE